MPPVLPADKDRSRMTSMISQTAAPTPTPAVSPWPYREFARLIIAQLVYGLSWSMFLLLPKFLTVELHATPVQIGLVSAVPSLAATLAVPFVGRMIDRVGRRPLILLGGAMIATQAFAFVWVDRIGPLLFVVQLVYGLSFVMAFNAAATHAADLVAPQYLTHALGIFGASNVVTNALAPAVGEPLAAAMGWKPVFLLAGGLGVCALLLALRIHDVKAPPADDARASAVPDSASGSIALYTLATAVTGAAFAVAFAFYQPFALSLGMHEVRGFFYGFAGSVFVSRVLFGSLPDRIGRKRCAVAALALYGLVEVAMSQLAPGTLVIYGALLGCAHGFFYPSINALAVAQTERRNRGRVMTFINGGFQFGYTVGVLAFGWIAGRTGYPTIFLLGGGIVTVAAIALARARAPQRAVAL
jgi:MFS family permease